MGVCCIVFDIDGILFEFFMNFLNIEKKKLLFFFKYFMFSSHFMLFSKHKKNIEKCPFTYWLNGRWFLQIVDRDSWNLYPLYPLFPCSDFVSQMWVVWGGGVMFFSHFMLFPTFIEKKNLGIQNNYFSFNVFFVFFLYAGNIEKCPFTYSYWLNGRWFLQIVDIGHFIMRLEILKSAPSLTG